MLARCLPFVLLFASLCAAQPSAADLARQYLIDLIRLDSTNPPGNETRVAEYLKKICDAHGIPNELLGGDRSRLNFIARLDGSTAAKPLLLMAHSDVVPVERSQWTVDPYAALVRDGFIYGRGAQDDKSLLAAELAVLVDFRRRGLKPKRGIVLLSEADEEAGSTGIQWLIANAYSKIDAEFAINEGGYSMATASGERVFNVQTSEKIPTRVSMTARGTAGHGSLPRPDNPVVHLARAIARLADHDQPVRMNSTTRRYFREIGKLNDFRWLAAFAPKLESAEAAGVANQIRGRDAELDAQLRTSVSPTMLGGGVKINVIPNVAEAQVDVRRLPNETQEEILDRFRRVINDPAVEVTLAPGQTMPATEPSAITTGLYMTMERVFKASVARGLVVPYMSRGATDGAFLRAKGMAVYGAPVFAREAGESRAHGNDERISLDNLRSGTNLLLKIVEAVVND